MLMVSAQPRKLFMGCMHGLVLNPNSSARHVMLMLGVYVTSLATPLRAASGDSLIVRPAVDGSEAC
jgi:hypothetical protein